MAEPFLGEIRAVGFSYAPSGWAFCDGSLLPIAQNTALFSLLGTTYGGNGQTNFALPDLRGKIAVEQGQGQGLSNYDLGQQGGTETVTISTAEMPHHTHGMGANSNDAGQTNPDTGYFAQPDNTIKSRTLYATATNASMNASAVQPTGGGQSHANMMPFQTVVFIIATQGIYPSRS
jgi:microcystin-dependent protein